MAVVHSEAGKLPKIDKLEHIPSLICAYYTEFPDISITGQCVSFGTSGHRGSSRFHSFNEEHIYAITQAVCDYRKANNIDGPLFIGKDTHALSEAAFRSALEVLVANDVTVYVAKNGSFTATPVMSHAIIQWNKGRTNGFADGIIITPSHNPPSDGGFKYNPPHGGPADTNVTSFIEKEANKYLENGNKDVKITNLLTAISSPLIKEYDYTSRYVDDLANVLDMESIAKSGLSLGVDPLGGASISLWDQIADKYNLDLTVVNKEVDSTFRFVPLDKDGLIRMDCSSPYAMNRLLDLRSDFDLAFACDPDADRHGIVTPKELMNPNHYLSVAAWYLLKTRQQWKNCAIGKTLVTTEMLNRIAKDLGHELYEVPVGFKWFVPYLISGKCGFTCEESAGASFLEFDGSAWTTDKDGPLMCLLAAEMTAKEGKSPSNLYEDLIKKYGEPLYQRLDAPADDNVRAKLKGLNAEHITMKTLAGSEITSIQTKASGNNESIGGVKVSTNDGWFAVRPSGTESICKVYTESFKDENHLDKLQKEAIKFLEDLFKS